MLDHVGFVVSDMSSSLAFYNLALAPLGIRRLMAHGGTEAVPDHVGFGHERKPYFWIGKGASTTHSLHVALEATSRELVDAFYKAAIAAGGRDNGAPGLRPHYHASYYGGFVLDPDGNNIEAVHHGF
jgi:catechol 2,3-dioxygenase-like lactoylglutathione lyase family enzyme